MVDDDPAHLDGADRVVVDVVGVAARDELRSPSDVEPDTDDAVRHHLGLVRAQLVRDDVAELDVLGVGRPGDDERAPAASSAACCR